MAQELYLDVFMINDYEIPNEQQKPITKEKTSREIQAELSIFF